LVLFVFVLKILIRLLFLVSNCVCAGLMFFPVRAPETLCVLQGLLSRFFWRSPETEDSCWVLFHKKCCFR